MLRFLVKTTVWLIPGVLMCYGIWFGLIHANPGRDSLGLYRLTPTLCHSMIFGTSRSAQGVNPAILEQLAPETGVWLNFSFNLGDSPWNNEYVDLIQQKINCSILPHSKSTFLLFVDPWAMDEKTGAGAQSWFSEKWVSACGTPSYIFAKNKSNPLDAFSYGSGSDLLSVVASSIPRQLIAAIKGDQTYFHHLGIQENGWLPSSGKLTRAQKLRAIESKVDNYRRGKVIGKHWPGSNNVAALKRCISYIRNNSTNSTVVIIRPPTSDAMRRLEDDWFPNANVEFERIARFLNIEFIDAHHEWKQRDVMHFNDGHHMCMEGANAFSVFLANNVLHQEPK